MSIYRSWITSLVFILCFGFASTSKAISFGPIKVYSYLDEPLVAELELTDLKAVSPNNLQVSLAASNDFVRAGMERPYFLTNLLFDITGYQGKTLIFIRSIKPVKTPYLEFLLNLSWPDGSLIKEYIILIDPPPFDLKAETRPKALSQLAVQNDDSKGFSEDNIKQQLQAQDLASRPNVVVQRPRDISNDQFSDETMDTEDPTTTVKTELVPGVVPDVTAATPASVPTATLTPTLTPTPSAAPVNAPTPTVDSGEYKRQAADFAKLEKQREDQQASDDKNTDVFDRVLERFKSNVVEVPAAIKPPAAATPAAVPATPAVVPATPAVVPVTPSVIPTTPAAHLVPSQIAATPPASSGGSFILLLGGALVVIVAGVALLIKRKLGSRPKTMVSDPIDEAISSPIPSPVLAKKDTKSAVVDEDDLDFDLDLSDEPAKDIFVEPKPDLNKPELDKFEDELTNTDLDKLLQTEKVELATPSAPVSTPAPIVEPVVEAVEEENIDFSSVPLPEDNLEGGVAAIKLKMDLAKRYLDAGDKDSAKQILHEVIDEAKDEQKLAAELMLSGIL